MSTYSLLLAHPSLCSDLESDAHLPTLLQRQPISLLRYTTAVDILAPLFDMAFFQDSVIDTLQNATYGKRLKPIKHTLWVWERTTKQDTPKLSMH